MQSNYGMNLKLFTPNVASEQILVFVRIRSLHQKDDQKVIDVVKNKEIHVKSPEKLKNFYFDRVFNSSTTQDYIFNSISSSVIDDVFKGFNYTIFTYGQSGSGKTHTILGNLQNGPKDEEVGIALRAIAAIFEKINLLHSENLIFLSWLEIFNEQLVDLLSPINYKLQIFDDSQKKSAVTISSLQNVMIKNVDEAYKLLSKGLEKRNRNNFYNSGSHTILTITVLQKDHDKKKWITGKLNLADLAGNESVKRGLREQNSNNLSLLTFGRCITALIERTSHVPYRESKLTRLLQDSLGGRSKALMIATINEGVKDIEDTLYTLEYAQRTRSIVNKPEINQKLIEHEFLKQYVEEIERLRRDLAAARLGIGFYMDKENYDLMAKKIKDAESNQEEIFKLEETNSKLETKVNELKTRLENLEEQYEKSKKENHTKLLHKTAIIDEHQKTEKKLTFQAEGLIRIIDKITANQQMVSNKLEEQVQMAKANETVANNLKNSLVIKNHQMLNEINQIEQNLKVNQVNLDLYKTNISMGKIDNDKNDNLNKLFAVLNNYDEINNLYDDCKIQHLDVLNTQSDTIKTTTNNSIANMKQMLEQNLSEISKIEPMLNETFNEKIENQNKKISKIKNDCDENNQFKINIHNKFIETNECFDTNNEKLKNQIENIDCLLNKESKCLINKTIGALNIFGERTKDFNQQFVDEINEHKNNLKEFEREITDDDEQLLKSISQHLNQSILGKTEEISKHIEKNIDKIKNSFDSAVESMEKIYGNILSNLDINSNAINDEINKFENDYSKSILEINSSIENDLNEEIASQNKVIEKINPKLECLNEIENQIIEFNEKMSRKIHDSLENYRNYLNGCLNPNYINPIGDTPDRRRMPYPRNFKITSPNERLIDRFNKENNND